MNLIGGVEPSAFRSMLIRITITAAVLGVLERACRHAGHLVTIEIYDRTFDFDLGHVSPNPPCATTALRAAV